MNQPTKATTVTIIGAGLGGIALVANLGLLGYRLRLHDRDEARIARVRERGGLDVEGLAKGFAPLELVTSQLAPAVDGADVIIVVTGSHFHADVARALAGQYLGIDAVAGSGANTTASRESGDVSAVADDVVAFNERYREKESQWRYSLDDINRRGRQAVLWGAGSKGVTFLNRLSDHARIATVVDTNHRKQGMYVPGTGQEIVAPERLRTEPPDVVIITNPIYRGEIQQSLAALGLAPEVVCA